MKRRLIELAILIATLSVLGVIVLVSGIVPIKASSGHWPITRWTLEFASERSVGLHSSGSKVPPLDERGMVPLGAATFDSNCRWCHGAPGFQQPPVAAQMTPHPPNLSEAVGSWDDEELFYILKHGIKFTGMPAWPTQKREQEIWPVVAFLRELPNMDAARYANLVEREIDDHVNESSLIIHLAQSCTSCHTLGGSGSVNSRVPVLSGQSEAYLRNSLIAYQTGTRYSGVMMPTAHPLTDEQIDALADYFSKQAVKPTRLSDSQQEDLIATGRSLAHQGDKLAKIPSCVDCHGPGEILRSDEYPKLAGQPADYLLRQLELFAQRDRGGSKNASLMHPVADNLNDSQRLSLSAYYASIKEDDN